jgi:hypothetical protein
MTAFIEHYKLFLKELDERGNNLKQKSKSAFEYCEEILTESLELVKLLEVLEQDGEEKFLEEFTKFWENEI